jgi:hypothetical protein
VLWVARRRGTCLHATRRLRHREPDRGPGRAARLPRRAEGDLLWDGLPAHSSKAMHAWMRRRRHWLVVEPLPGYAPDLNPGRGVVVQPQGVDLAYLDGDTLEEVTARPSVVSSGSAAPRTWPTRSCAAACPCGEQCSRRWNGSTTYPGGTARTLARPVGCPQGTAGPPKAGPKAAADIPSVLSRPISGADGVIVPAASPAVE